MKKKYTIKQILLSQQNWWKFYTKHHSKLRIAIIVGIVKLLSCKHIVRGYRTYHCSNPNCSHIKRVPFTCKSKACSSCGKKATELWIQKQNQVLPNTTWQHITFTMPCELWDFFWTNRELLHDIPKLAADCIQTLARQKKIMPGIFTALHSFGRDMKRNVHLHLSTTTGGLSQDGTQWKSLYFEQNTLMRMWRYRIIKLFRSAHQKKTLILPSTLQKQGINTSNLNNLLNRLYQKSWIVHCSKPSKNHKHTVDYLGRYIKRPPIAESKLRHYDGADIAFNYLDHTTHTYRRFTLTVEQFIRRFVQHIPDIGFRMIRYYGFLANRVRGQLLPIVYNLLKQKIDTPTPPPPSYAQLIQKNFNFNPLTCILCGQPMLPSTCHFGQTSLHHLLGLHRQLALLKKI